MREKCSNFIYGGKKITEKGVNRALEGCMLIRNYKFTQLRTRLMYERTLATGEDVQ